VRTTKPATRLDFPTIPAGEAILLLPEAIACCNGRAMEGHKTTHGSNCQNCGEPLAGPYCSACGQHDVDYHRSFGPMVEDALEGFFHFDGKFLKSARYIFTRPGFLTNEFIAGRRVRYAHPLRFYIFASFLFFAVTALTDHQRTPAESARDAKELADELKAEGIETPAAKAQSADAASAAAAHPGGVAPAQSQGADGSSRVKALQGVLNKAANVDRQAFARELAHLLPEMLFFCLPILALMLTLAFHRSGRFYIEHMIFALHIQAFVFLAMIIASAVTYLAHFISDGVQQLASAIVFFGSIWLAYRAFANVYGRSSGMVSVKFVLVGLAYGAFLLAALLVLVGVSAFLVSHGHG
jgi:Protein of unknown function (DUF3667)